ncbi:hypothetical protein [Actinophytocola oryzae]|uniref:Uncharacterized protein n=1 Tax=Actinophytocola oryzae TaxID=502181 RepID=A0A4R7VVS2_9PSEU|nr:hypothetical protein [Actinophytocola oryzae]TDV54004.1 hypothetical protein CLV71_104473 [Actinophytocola oryzae]
MKVLSRLASPAGFVLVLLLFFLLPFVSVSCDVPGYGEAGANYTGSHLVSGADPEVPAELREFAEDPETPAELVDPPDAGVGVLAVVLAVFAAAGALTVLLPRLKTRLLGSAAVATATLVVTVITMVVAQSHLTSALIDGVRRSGLAEQQDSLQQIESAADRLTHTALGFWLMVILLALIAVVTGTLGLFGERLHAARAEAASSGDRRGSGLGGLGGLSFGDDAHERSQAPPHE